MSLEPPYTFEHMKSELAKIIPIDEKKARICYVENQTTFQIGNGNLPQSLNLNRRGMENISTK